jgi:hypothetical protein
MATAFNPYRMDEITVVVHNCEQIVYLEKEDILDAYKRRLVKYLEEINKSYQLPTSVLDESTHYSSMMLQLMINMLKDEKSVKKISKHSLDLTKEYFTNVFDIV